MSGALDRRWIYLAMMLAVALPILWNGVTGKTFPESPTPPSQACFDAVEALPEGSRVLVSFDYDPASEGELAPMAKRGTERDVRWLLPWCRRPW